MIRRTVRAVGVAATAFAVVVAIAAPGARATSPASDRPTGSRPSGEIVVFAASSLTEAFTALGRAFERQHRDTTVTFSFGASSALATQISAGAPADLFASADEADVERIADTVRGEAELFARNRLTIAVEPGNPRSIHGLADTTEPDILLALCAREVPCGALARRAFRRADVAVPDAVSSENVKAALTTVILGEADAAVVYRTDVLAADGTVDGVDIPARHNVGARYPIAVLRDGNKPRLARAFSRFVRSEGGQRVLDRLGFLAP